MTFNLGSEGNVYLTGIDGQDQDTYGFDYRASPEYSYSLGCAIHSSAKSSPNWAFSPPATLASPPIESPRSASGVHPFDQSFASVQNSIDNRTFIPLENTHVGYPPNAYQSNTQGEAQPFLSLAAANDTTTFDDMEDDSETPRPVTYQTSRLPSPTTNYQPNWGSRSSRRSLRSSSSPRTVRSSKRRTSSDKEHSRSKSESTSRLRSVQSSRTTTFSATASSPGQAFKGTRTNHNQVEKQYRNRLNGRFEALLRTLPRGDEEGADKRISKAEVLVLAKRHISQLEGEKRVLEEERQKLEGRMEELKRRFVGIGGVCIP